MAADRAGDLDIPLAAEHGHRPEAQCLPPTWSHANPIDIVGDATPERYRDAILAVASDPDVDGILVMLTPQAMTQPMEVAKAVIEAHEQTGTALLTCWMGEEQVSAARKSRRRRHPGLPHAGDRGRALLPYLDLLPNQKLLLQTRCRPAATSGPGSRGRQDADRGSAFRAAEDLSEMESKAILRAFRVPVAQTMVARTPTEALLLAEQIGFPIAMKVDSPDLSAQERRRWRPPQHPGNALAVRNAYHDIIGNEKKKYPNARINGVSIEPYLARPMAES